jgi:GTP-binding protein
MKEIDGKKQEPVEQVVINVEDALSGTIINMLNERKGMMQNMISEG